MDPSSFTQNVRLAYAMRNSTLAAVAGQAVAAAASVSPHVRAVDGYDKGRFPAPALAGVGSFPVEGRGWRPSSGSPIWWIPVFRQEVRES
jgi:hypothetical protein